MLVKKQTLKRVSTKLGTGFAALVLLGASGMPIAQFAAQPCTNKTHDFSCVF